VVNLQRFDSWKKRLPEICSGYSKDVWNIAESGVFLPGMGFGQIGKQSMGVKG